MANSRRTALSAPAASAGLVFILAQIILVTCNGNASTTELPAAAGSGSSTPSVISLSSTAAAPTPTASAPVSAPNCSAVAPLFERRGIKLADIPLRSKNEKVLRYCEQSSGTSCCSYAMETKLALSSKVHTESTSKDLISKLSTLLSSRAQKFNDMFNLLLQNSKKEFHAMFKRTYGVIYEQNAYVFSDLFGELEKYYARGRVDLAEAMDNFFNTLYQKMFTVLNAQYTFDEQYLSCVSEHMKELKPFGDVHDKLSVQIKRSFVATRTYAQALITAADVVKKMTNIRLNADCIAAITKMQQCGACKGYAEKPCTNFCVNVMRGCYHYFHEMDSEWDNFVAAMEKVAERLLGSFNIVMVVEPINIKISEAIMNFQESGRDISNQVFQGCGRPVLGRGKRSINPKFIEPNHSFKTPSALTPETDADILDIDESPEDEIVLKESSHVVKRFAEPDPEPKERNNKQYGNSGEQNAQRGGGGGGRKRKKQQKKNDDDDYVEREPVLDKLIKEIRQKIKDSKKFWSNMPSQICSSEEISTPSDDGRCWNGTRVDRYLPAIAVDQSTNPEFKGNPATIRQTSTVASQLYHLKTATNQLKNAYNGLDVNWSDPDDTEDGSGEREGSGAGIDDEDDSEDGADDDEGSGLGGFKPDHTDPNTGRVNNIDHEDDSSSVTHNTSGPKYPSGNHDDNRIDHDDEHITNKPKSSDSSRLKEMSPRRAIFMYLLPLYMAWFGGIISDLL